MPKNDKQIHDGSDLSLDTLRLDIARGLAGQRLVAVALLATAVDFLPFDHFRIPSL